MTDPVPIPTPTAQQIQEAQAREAAGAAAAAAQNAAYLNNTLPVLPANAQNGGANYTQEQIQDAADEAAKYARAFAPIDYGAYANMPLSEIASKYGSDFADRVQGHFTEYPTAAAAALTAQYNQTRNQVVGTQGTQWQGAPTLQNPFDPNTAAGIAWEVARTGGGTDLRMNQIATSEAKAKGIDPGFIRYATDQYIIRPKFAEEVLTSKTGQHFENKAWEGAPIRANLTLDEIFGFNNKPQNPLNAKFINIDTGVHTAPGDWGGLYTPEPTSKSQAQSTLPDRIVGGKTDAAFDNVGLTTFVPEGNLRHIAIENTKDVIDPATGEIGIYKYNERFGTWDLIGGGGRNAAQSGMFSVNKPLTSAVYTQESGGTKISKYGNEQDAIDILLHPDNYSRLGAEAYGGVVRPMDNRQLQPDEAMSRYYGEGKYDLANLALPVAMGKAEAPGAAIPWSIKPGSPNVQLMNEKGIVNDVTSIPDEFLATYGGVSGKTAPASAAPAPEPLTLGNGIYVTSVSKTAAPSPESILGIKSASAPQNVYTGYKAPNPLENPLGWLGGVKDIGIRGAEIAVNPKMNINMILGLGGDLVGNKEVASTSTTIDKTTGEVIKPALPAPYMSESQKALPKPSSVWDVINPLSDYNKQVDTKALGDVLNAIGLKPQTTYGAEQMQEGGIVGNLAKTGYKIAQATNPLNIPEEMYGLGSFALGNKKPLTDFFGKQEDVGNAIGKATQLGYYNQKMEGYDLPLGLGHIGGGGKLIEANDVLDQKNVALRQAQETLAKNPDVQSLTTQLKTSEDKLQPIGEKLKTEGTAMDQAYVDLINQGKLEGGQLGHWDTWTTTDKYTKADQQNLEKQISAYQADSTQYTKILGDYDTLRNKYDAIVQPGQAKIDAAQKEFDRQYEAVQALQGQNQKDYLTTSLKIPGTNESIFSGGEKFLKAQEDLLSIGTDWMPQTFGTAGSFTKGAVKMGVYTLDPILFPLLQVAPTTLPMAEMAIRNPEYVAHAAIQGLNPWSGKESLGGGSVYTGLTAPFKAGLLDIPTDLLTGKPITPEQAESAGALAAMLGGGTLTKAGGEAISPLTSRIPGIRDLGIGGTIRDEQLATDKMLQYSDLGKPGELVTKPFKYIPGSDLVYTALTGKNLADVTGRTVRPEIIYNKIRTQPTVRQGLSSAGSTLIEGIGIGKLIGFNKDEQLQNLNDYQILSGKAKGMRPSSWLFPKEEITGTREVAGKTEVTTRPFQQNPMLLDQSDLAGIYTSTNPKVYPTTIPKGTVSDWSGQPIDVTAKISDVFHHTDLVNDGKKGVYLTPEEHNLLHQMQNGEVPIEPQFYNRYSTLGGIRKFIGTHLLNEENAPFTGSAIQSELNAMRSAPSRKYTGEPDFLAKFIEKEGYTPGASDLYTGTVLTRKLMNQASTPEARLDWETKYKRLQDILTNTRAPENVRHPSDVIDQMDGYSKGDGKQVVSILKKYDNTMTGSVVESMFSKKARVAKDLDILTNTVKDVANDLGQNFFVKKFGKENVRISVAEDGESASISVKDSKTGEFVKKADIHTHQFGGIEGQRFQYGLAVEAPVKIDGLNVMDLREQRLRKVASTMGLRKSTAGDWITTAQLDTRYKDIGDSITAIDSEMIGATTARKAELQSLKDVLNKQLQSTNPIPADQLKIAQEAYAKGEVMPLGSDEGAMFVKIPATKRYVDVLEAWGDAKAAPGKVVEGAAALPGRVGGGIEDIIFPNRMNVQQASGGIQETLHRSPFLTKDIIMLDPTVTNELVSELQTNRRFSAADVVRSTTDALQELVQSVNRNKTVFSQKRDFAFDHPDLKAGTATDLLDTFTNGKLRNSIVWYGSKAFSRFFDTGAFRDVSRSDFDGYVDDAALPAAINELTRISKIQSNLRLEVSPDGKEVKLFKNGNAAKPIVELHAKSMFPEQARLPTRNLRSSNGATIRSTAPELMLTQVFDGMFRRAVLDPTTHTVDGMFVRKLKHFGDAIGGLRQGAADIYTAPPAWDVFGIRRTAAETRAATLNRAADAIQTYINDPEGLERDIGISRQEYANLPASAKVKNGKVQYQNVPWDVGEFAKNRAAANALTNPVLGTPGTVGEPAINIRGSTVAKGAALVGGAVLASAVLAQPASAASNEQQNSNDLTNDLAIIGMSGLVAAGLLAAKGRGESEPTGRIQSMRGDSFASWEQMGYPSRENLLPVKYQDLTIRGKEGLTRETSPVNEAERRAWQAQQDQIALGEPQYEGLAIQNPGKGHAGWIRGERFSVGLENVEGNPIYEYSELGHNVAHPHPTDVGIQLPTPSQKDHAWGFDEGAGTESVVSPNKVYRMQPSELVYAPKYQTKYGKDILNNEDIWQLSRSDANRFERRNALEEKNTLQYTKRTYMKALNDAVPANDPFYETLKNQIKVAGSPKPEGYYQYEWQDAGTSNDLFPQISENGGRARLKLSDNLESQYRSMNRKNGIPDLTDSQAKTLETLRTNEGKAYNSIREYVMAKNMQRIGGKLTTADITKAHMESQAPAEFKEVPASAQALRDLKREYQQTKNTLKRSATSDRDIINQITMPTTEIDVEAMRNVPLSKQIAGRIGIAATRLKWTIKDHFENSPGWDDTEPLPKSPAVSLVEKTGYEDVADILGLSKKESKSERVKPEYQKFPSVLAAMYAEEPSTRVSRADVRPRMVTGKGGSRKVTPLPEDQFNERSAYTRVTDQQKSELNIVDDVFGSDYTKQKKQLKEQDYQKVTYQKTQKYPTIAEMMGYPETQYPKQKEYPKTSRYQKPTQYQKVERYPEVYQILDYNPVPYQKPTQYQKQNYPKPTLIDEILGYPVYTKPEKYPNYPEKPTYQKPSYPKYPEEPNYPNYPNYPEYPTYPKYPPVEEPTYPKTPPPPTYPGLGEAPGGGGGGGGGNAFAKRKHTEIVGGATVYEAMRTIFG